MKKVVLISSMLFISLFSISFIANSNNGVPQNSEIQSSCDVNTDFELITDEDSYTSYWAYYENGSAVMVHYLKDSKEWRYSYDYFSSKSELIIFLKAECER